MTALTDVRGCFFFENRNLFVISCTNAHHVTVSCEDDRLPSIIDQMSSEPVTTPYFLDRPDDLKFWHYRPIEHFTHITMTLEIGQLVGLGLNL